MPPYRLQSLLEIRERAEQAAKDAFAAATNALREQERLQKEMEEELERMIEDRNRRRDDYSKKLASGEMKVTEQSAAYRFIERLKEKEQEQKFKIEAQKENVRNAEKELKRAQDALIIATQDLKALQKHKEKWQAEVKKERAAKEEDMLDEIGQVIFNKGKKGG
jgi:flagellar export protein FliJ